MTAHPVLQRVATLCIFYWMVAPQFSLGQAPGQVERRRQHPDGMVGQISLHGYAHYASVSKDPGDRAIDAQRLALGLNLVASPQLTVETGYEAFKQDSVRHTLRGGMKYYLKNPLDKSARHNPDGQIGGVVLSLAVGARFSDSPTGATKAVGNFNITLPVSARLSLVAGYRYFEEIEADDAAQGYGRLTVFFSEYPPDSAYVNPDGPAGYPVMGLAGGGSSKGIFGQISLIFPLDRKMSLKAIFTAERINSPYRLSLAVGVGISFYPQGAVT